MGNRRGKALQPLQSVNREELTMIIDINKNIKLIRPEGKAAFPYSNSLYIKGDPSVLIDAGSGGQAYKKIMGRVDLLLLTHNHFDHINGVSFFPRAAVWASHEEAPGYRDAALFALYAGFQHWREMMGFERPTSFARVTSLPDDVPTQPGFQAIDLAGEMRDGDCWDTGSERVVCLHTPGHSHGHCSFWLEKSGVLFSGDIDLSPYGPWYGGNCSDFDQFEASIHRLMNIRPPVLATSHRRLFRQGPDDIPRFMRDYLEMALRKERCILEYLQEPRTFMQIAAQSFLNTYPAKTDYTRFWTRMMLWKHLQRLQKRGEVGKNPDDERYFKNV